MHDVLSHQEAATQQSRSGAISRRVFLRLVGVVAASAALGGCSRDRRTRSARR